MQEPTSMVQTASQEQLSQVQQYISSNQGGAWEFYGGYNNGRRGTYKGAYQICKKVWHSASRGKFRYTSLESFNQLQNNTQLDIPQYFMP